MSTENNIYFNPELKGFLPQRYASEAEFRRHIVQQVPAELQSARDAWAEARGVKDGGIVTTAYDIVQMKSRFDVQCAQVRYEDNKARPLPQGVERAFNNDNWHPWLHDGSIAVLIDSTTQWSMHFDLGRSFPGLDFRTTHTSPSIDYMRQFNGMVRKENFPLIHSEVFKPAYFRYRHEWQNYSYDVAIIDYAILYKTGSEVQRMAKQLHDSSVKTVVYSNVLPNTAASDDQEQWTAQYSKDPSGGIFAVRIPPRNELKKIMRSLGYVFVESATEKTTLTDPRYSAIAAQAPDWDYSIFRHLRL